MNKTAIQLDLERLTERKINAELTRPYKSEFHQGRAAAYNKAILLITELLPTEQEQIEDAYTQGAEDEYHKKDKHGKTYYNETYKTEE
jgi:hypothetical protein